MKLLGLLLLILFFSQANISFSTNSQQPTKDRFSLLNLAMQYAIFDPSIVPNESKHNISKLFPTPKKFIQTLGGIPSGNFDELGKIYAKHYIKYATSDSVGMLPLTAESNAIVLRDAFFTGQNSKTFIANWNLLTGDSAQQRFPQNHRNIKKYADNEDLSLLLLFAVVSIFIFISIRPFRKTAGFAMKFLSKLLGIALGAGVAIAAFMAYFYRSVNRQTGIVTDGLGRALTEPPLWAKFFITNDPIWAGFGWHLFDIIWFFGLGYLAFLLFDYGTRD